MKLSVGYISQHGQYHFMVKSIKISDEKGTHIYYIFHSVEGMNFDFVAMNLTGFIFYSLYNTYGYFIKSDQTGQVDLNDVIFAYHALFATLVCITQIAIYPGGKNRIHAPTIGLLLLMWTFILIYATLTIVIYIFYKYSKQKQLKLVHN